MVCSAARAATDTQGAIDAVWGIAAPRLMAGLPRIARDEGIGEKLPQDARVLPLERWPETGGPDNAGAWLMTTARRRAIHHYRRRKRLDRKHQQLLHELE